MSEKTNQIIDPPIAIPPEAGLEVWRRRFISHQDGQKVIWDAQMRYNAAVMQRHRSGVGRKPPVSREYRRIMGISVMWFWILMSLMLILLATGIKGEIAGRMKQHKDNGKDHDKEWIAVRHVISYYLGSIRKSKESGHGPDIDSNLTSVKWPCQQDPRSNNRIIPITPGDNIPPINFLQCCNRTVDVSSSKLPQRFAGPDTMTNMSGCMEACFDYTAGNGPECGNEARVICLLL